MPLDLFYSPALQIPNLRQRSARREGGLIRTTLAVLRVLCAPVSPRQQQRPPVSPVSLVFKSAKCILMGVDPGAAILVAGVLLTWSIINIAKTPLLSLRLPDNGIRVSSTGSMIMSPGEVPRRRQGRGVLDLYNSDDDADNTDT
eukprot:TRINITY_DN15228_c0_g1_i1.p1 TRINITY_DN15228_c0_g1~~TRINITY_DN15228_c0_g1_i1.p1  ORF type:complete len:144 (-),score=3.44 TRINITY_DN15228_c0_g1_i1:462-893(-)